MVFKIFSQEPEDVHDIFWRFEYPLIDFLQEEIFVFAGDFPGMIYQAVSKSRNGAFAFIQTIHG